MKGIIISIEGTDGSGKQTQSLELERRLLNRGLPARKVSFPRYKDEASALLRRYLKGEYGFRPEDVNPYTASTFYAVDRADAFLGDIGDFYNNGGILITDRYTTSNLIHQASKIDSVEERESFVDWLEDFEYKKLQIPKPDIVFYLDLPSAISDNLINQRSIDQDRKKDIHEQDKEYLDKSKKRALDLIERCQWNRIDCMENNSLKSVSKIADQIEAQVLDLLKIIR